MKKTIIMSLLTILVVAGLVGAGTFAYFSDTESSTGNTFTAGTIDIAVNGENPWVNSVPFAMNDLKPCETGTINFTVTNVGTNPVVLWKHIGDVVCDTGLLAYPVGNAVFSSEPESAAAGGTAAGDNNGIDKVINYDLKVNDRVIFTDTDGLAVDDIQSMWMPLGTLEHGESLTVVQSYHMRADTGNWAQGDRMTFTIDLYAEQKLGNGPTAESNRLFLDNKALDTWYFIPDAEWAILDYSIAAGMMTYDLKAQGLQYNADYSLIYYPEPQTTWPWPVTSLGTWTAAGGKINATGVLVLGAIHDSNAKIWLCKTSDLSGGSYTTWPPLDTLFESNKINIP